MHGRSSLIQKKRTVQFAAKGQARSGVPLENFYSWERKRNVRRLQKNIPRFQFAALIQEFIPSSRNIRNGQFVYTGAAG
jgi:hypothetical protein